ncbi:uncharacterized protein LAJ45_11392 [Morchella importuna]|uniref:Glycerol:H+ symporter n=1 Tax=Morchella conica CCBAS932 TaxID=1392247 RepID=A0A3N4KG73_9PEZI|nr:uncharacterized protein LAJ45_11392 [Morchella importuna]KAH8144624.1 hypothetical protein LAJ45_11392 [Morchella importuna]RPB08359.1 glycerol:H+ symporter [Morchella conica CCBAS932]
MRLISTLRDIFSLETLDSRFTDGTLKTAHESRESKKVREEAGPARWKTPEFFLYYVVFAIAVPSMFKVAIDLSQESHPNYPKYKHLLSPGWIPGRQVDNSDHQFRSFRSNMPILFCVLALHSVLRRIFDYAFNTAFPPPPVTSSHRASHNITRRNIFDVLFALIFLTALHAFSIIKILVILTGNYLISFFHPTSIANPILTWIFNMAVLFANEYCDGYRFATILPWLIAGEGAGVGEAMDKAFGGGLLPRWSLSFNITVMRLISYNLDHYWAAKRREEGAAGGAAIEVRTFTAATTSTTPPPPGHQHHRRRSDEESRRVSTDRASAGGDDDGDNQRLMADVQKKTLEPGKLTERERIDHPARYEDYGFLSYLAYALYSPLYLAGPILTFNDFVYQQRYPSSTIGFTRHVLKYGLRLLFTILTMEVILHYTYVVAISKTASRGSWAGDTPAQLSMIGYFNLHIIWLKLLIPWRFFRLWSLLDAVDPPENMLRCMSNNYSAVTFWRAWHRSYNRWTVRYIYIPLGGATRPVLGMVVVFTFVALWHDLSFKLLMWGWMVVLFILPELVARRIVTKRRFAGRERLYRNLCALGGVANCLMMMAANLVGFAIGVDGLRDLMRGVLGAWEGGVFMMVVGGCLFVGVQVMLEVREEEARMGVNLKC